MVLFLSICSFMTATASPPAPPSVEYHPGQSQVFLVAVAGGNTTGTRYLGSPGSAEACAALCLQLEEERCESFTYYSRNYQPTKGTAYWGRVEEAGELLNGIDRSSIAPTSPLNDRFHSTVWGQRCRANASGL